MAKKAAVIVNNKHILSAKVTNKKRTVSLYPPDKPLIKSNKISRLHYNGDTVVIGLNSGRFLELTTEEFEHITVMGNVLSEVSEEWDNEKIIL